MLMVLPASCVFGGTTTRHMQAGMAIPRCVHDAIGYGWVQHDTVIVGVAPLGHKTVQLCDEIIVLCGPRGVLNDGQVWPDGTEHHGGGQGHHRSRRDRKRHPPPRTHIRLNVGQVAAAQRGLPHNQFCQVKPLAAGPDGGLHGEPCRRRSFRSRQPVPGA